MPSEDTKVLEFNQYQKSDKAPFIIYEYLECLKEKTEGCKNNPANSSTTKLGEHFPSDFSMSTIMSIKNIECKHNVYRGRSCMKMFCKSLREPTVKIINFTRNEVINKQTVQTVESSENAKICLICKEKCKEKQAKDKNYVKLGIIAIIRGNKEVLHITHVI